MNGKVDREYINNCGAREHALFYMLCLLLESRTPYDPDDWLVDVDRILRVAEGEAHFMIGFSKNYTNLTADEIYMRVVHWTEKRDAWQAMIKGASIREAVRSALAWREKIYA